MVTEWRNMKGWPRNYGVLLCLAIEDYNKKLAKLSESELENLNRSNIKMIHKWQDEGLIDPNARGVPSRVKA